MKTTDIEQLKKDHPDGPVVPDEITQFAKGWIQGWLDSSQDDDDAWHGIGDFDLNLTFDEDTRTVSVVAYLYDDDLGQTDGDYFTKLASIKVPRKRKRS